MNIDKLIRIVKSVGGKKIYFKRLSPNDNSKNQVYLGGSFEILNIFPMSDVFSDSSGNWARDRFKAKLDFYWITEEGNFAFTPNSQLILYPKYPEVRFSGFLLGCAESPSELMNQRLADRLLFLTITGDGKILGYVAGPESDISIQTRNLQNIRSIGIFSEFSIENEGDSKSKLICELIRIHDLGWIDSKRLDSLGNIIPCNSSNCGGYTLEAELGVRPNGYSEPDFCGWEIKQYGVSNFDKIESATVTLMTPEPTGGYYVDEGIEKFIQKYGYDDMLGREDRRNFGGIYKIGNTHPRTNLTLQLIGFDNELKKIKNTNGRIALIDNDDQEVANWSFSSLLLHWNRKHNKACYIPSLSRSITQLQYYFSDKVLMGEGTDFLMFLSEMYRGHIYYDPGIKIENISSKPKVKRRSQFRIRSLNLKNLYKTQELYQLK